MRLHKCESVRFGRASVISVIYPIRQPFCFGCSTNINVLPTVITIHTPISLVEPDRTMYLWSRSGARPYLRSGSTRLPLTVNGGMVLMKGVARAVTLKRSDYHMQRIGGRETSKEIWRTWHIHV